MARPNLSALISRFLFRETLSTQDKTDIRTDINALKNDAADVLALLDGETLTVDDLRLGDTSADVLPSGAIGGTGTNGELAVHNDSDTGGIKYQLTRNIITGVAIATSAEIQAGNVHKEIGRFRLEPSEIAAQMGKWYLMTGKLIIQSDTDSSLGAAPYVGIHIDGITSTSVARGVYIGATAGASGYYLNELELFVPVLIYNKSGTTFNLQADGTKMDIHCWQSVYNAGALAALNLPKFEESAGFPSNDALKANPADIILSLRVTQDATFTGSVTLVAKDVQLTPLQ